METKEILAKKIEKFADKIAKENVGFFLWGEEMMPECLRKEIEDEKMQDEK